MLGQDTNHHFYDGPRQLLMYLHDDEEREEIEKDKNWDDNRSKTEMANGIEIVESQRVLGRFVTWWDNVTWWIDDEWVIYADCKMTEVICSI